MQKIVASSSVSQCAVDESSRNGFDRSIAYWGCCVEPFCVERSKTKRRTNSLSIGVHWKEVITSEIVAAHFWFHFSICGAERK